MASAPVIVVTHDNADIDTVRAACEAQGLSQVNVLRQLRMLTGVIDEEKKGGLEGVPGVSSVERERQVQLPPKDSPIQ